MITSLPHNYLYAPPHPWCQHCGIDFEDDEQPHRVNGRDYHRECLENDEQGDARR